MKIVVAYSGGLDTSVLLKWIQQRYDAEVIAYCADIGQGEELDGLEQKALATGASHCVIDPLVEPFAKDYIYPMMRAQAIYEGRYLLGTSIARPCITEGMMRVVAEHGADAIAHGATGKGNDQVRFELSAAALDPKVEAIAPWRDEGFRKQFPGRKEMIEYAREQGIEVKASLKKPYSMDRNLLHISYEAGALEDPWYDATGPEDREMYLLSADPELAPDTPDVVQLLFEKGDAVGIHTAGLEELLKSSGVQSRGRRGEYTLLSPAGLFQVLNALGGKHGIGRADLVENRFVGMKSRGIYETPGGTIYHQARRDLELLTTDREALRLRDQLIPQYAQMVYNGFWFAPERLAAQALVDQVAETVTGEVRLKLYKGAIYNAGRRSKASLYSESIASMEGGNELEYNQNDASGFIRLQALRLRQFASVHEGSLGTAESEPLG